MSKKTEATHMTTTAEPELQPLPNTPEVNRGAADNNTSNSTKETTMSKKTESTHATTTAQPEHLPMPDTHDLNRTPAEDNTNNNTRETTMSKKTEDTRATTTVEPEHRPMPDTHDANRPPAENDVLSQLRISQDFASKQGAKKLITTIRLGKPNKGEFVRVNSETERMLVWTLVDEQETYVVTKDIGDSIPGDVVPKELVLTITRQGNLLLWPLRIPGDDGRINNWHASAREAADRAVHVWVRVQSNMALGAYDVYEAVGALPDPEWPNLSMDEIVRIAVKGRVIDSLDHPVLRKLRGEV
jgi:hypothetical protein